MASPFITAEVIGTLRNDLTFPLGFAFTCGTDVVTVSQLGRYVFAGNALTHLLTLYDWTAGAVIASVTVDCNGAPTNAYLYGAVGPIALVPGQRYSIESAELAGGDQYTSNDTTVTHDTAFGGAVQAVFSHIGVSTPDASWVPTNFIGATPPGVGARVAQIGVEVSGGLVPGLARVAQIAIEVLHSLDAIPDSGGTGAWFKVLEGDIFTDRDLID